MVTEIKIQLVYRDDQLGDSWRSQFARSPNVQIVNADITSIACDAVVSPANSFGFMDGGLDNALSERFGWDLQTRVQHEIQARPERELLVGQSIVVSTHDSDIPWLIVAPTMRVPMSFNIASSINAYLAMKAILIAATTHTEIDCVAVPGLCTGVGRMDPETSATQMFAAYNETVGGSPPNFADFGEAQKHQVDLNPDGMIWDY